MACNTREQRWARLLGAMRMLVLLAMLRVGPALSWCSLCARHRMYLSRSFSRRVSNHLIVLGITLAAARRDGLGRAMEGSDAVCGRCGRARAGTCEQLEWAPCGPT